MTFTPWEDFYPRGLVETEDPKSGRDISSLLAHSLAFSPARWIRLKALLSSCFPYLCINYLVYIWKNDHHVTRLKKKKCPTGAGILANLTKMQEPFPSNQFNDVSENAVTFINAMPCHIRKK